MFFGRFLDISYWLGVPTNLIVQPLLNLVLFCLFLFLIVGMWLRFSIRSSSTLGGPYKTYKRRWSRWFITFGILGYLYLFLRSERIPYLGRRFWYLVFVLAFGIWAYRLWRYKNVRIPEIERRKNERRPDPYLPRRKKK